MAEPIRLLHFADTHIGMENYGRTSPQTGLNSRVEDFLRRMDEMIAFAREHDVDLTIFAGDAFKTRTPNPTYQREFAYRIRDLAALAPIIMLIGNHDVPPMALKASSIEIYDTLQVPNVWVASEYEDRVVQTKRGPVIVGAAPYPLRSRLLEKVDTAGMTIADIDQMMRADLIQVLDSLAAEADGLAVAAGAPAVPRVLTAHFSIDEATLGSERQVMLGRDVSVPVSALADPRWDYVALGHVHRHQNLTHKRSDAPPVVYSGSMERIDFGEEGDEKGFCWVELARGATQWQFEKVAARKFVTIRADLRETDEPTQDVVALINRYNLQDCVVRIRVDLSLQTEARFDESLIRDVLRQAGVNMIAAVSKDVEQPIRTRLGGSPEGLTDLELLERYLVSKDVDRERRVKLLDAAETIFSAAQSELE